MKQMTRTVLGLLVGAALLTGVAFAEEIGVVDMQTVTQKSTKAQQIAAQVKTKEQELGQLQEDYAKQLKAADKLSPVEKKNLEDKLKNQFATKVKEYRDWTLSQEALVRDDFDQAVKQVATTQKLTLILPKQAVLSGGHDVTEAVVSLMNK